MFFKCQMVKNYEARIGKQEVKVCYRGSLKCIFSRRRIGRLRVSWQVSEGVSKRVDICLFSFNAGEILRI